MTKRKIVTSMTVGCIAAAAIIGIRTEKESGISVHHETCAITSLAEDSDRRPTGSMVPDGPTVSKAKNVSHRPTGSMVPDGTTVSIL